MAAERPASSAAVLHAHTPTMISITAAKNTMPIQPVGSGAGCRCVVGPVVVGRVPDPVVVGRVPDPVVVGRVPDPVVVGRVPDPVVVGRVPDPVVDPVI